MNVIYYFLALLKPQIILIRSRYFRNYSDYVVYTSEATPKAQLMRGDTRCRRR